MKNSYISALFTDKYQITMMYAHWKNGSHLNRCAFDLYFRSLPFRNGYAVFAGLHRVIEYLSGLHFTEDDLSYLQFTEPYLEATFLDLLRSFQFNGDLYAVPEGTLVFPGEPLLRIEGTIMELQLVETALLNFVGYQTLVATKAARIRRVCKKEALMEFGTRRAQEMDAAIWGARAAYIAGFDATSNLAAGKKFNIPTAGTHSHSWIQNFDTEDMAYRTYVNAIQKDVTLLVDTYDTLESGLPHAIEVGLRLKENGILLHSIRIDSGDLASLSRKARTLLDNAGLTQTKIIASGDLDEYRILELKKLGAKIDSWGIGTRLITAFDQPAMGVVYKMVARQHNEKWIPTLKISSDKTKSTIPGRKTWMRVISDNNEASFDIVMGTEEKLEYAIRGERKSEGTLHAKELLVHVYKKGTLKYILPSLDEARRYHQEQIRSFQDKYLCIHNPSAYPVHFSNELIENRNKLVQEIVSCY